jgi:hypothetical protein
MPGPLIKASQVPSEYGSRVARKNKKGKIVLKNSEGRERAVSPGASVYHRGDGKFAEYDSARDRKIKAKRKGTGAYKQTGDSTGSKKRGGPRKGARKKSGKSGGRR